MSAAAAARAPVLVVLHVLHVAARPHEVGPGRPGGRRGRPRVGEGIPRVAGRVGRAPTGLGPEELRLGAVVIVPGRGDGRRRGAVGGEGGRPRGRQVGGGEDDGAVGRAHHHRGRRVRRRGRRGRRGGDGRLQGDRRGRVEAAAAVPLGLLQGMQAEKKMYMIKYREKRIYARLKETFASLLERLGQRGKMRRKCECLFFPPSISRRSRPIDQDIISPSNNHVLLHRS